MSAISIRKIDTEVIQALRLQASENGVSMEEEARRILAGAVTKSVKITDLALELFGSENGADLELEKRTIHEPINLNKCIY